MINTGIVSNVRRLLISLLFLAFCFVANAAVSVNVVKTTYDSNFNPTFVVEIENTDSKTLTNVIVKFSFKAQGTSLWDVFSYKYYDENMSVTVYPNSKGYYSVSFSVPEGYNYSGLILEKVRFVDGSIRSR